MKLTREYIGEELAIFWESPYGNGREKIASFWWPCHPPDKTHEVERAFEALADKLIAAPDSPVIPDSSREPMIGYALRSMPDLEANPDTYPVAFRVMWDKAAAMDELLRLTRLEREKGSGITFSMHEVEVDAPAVADTPAAQQLDTRNPTDKESLTVQPLDTREREWRVAWAEGDKFRESVTLASEDIADTCLWILEENRIPQRRKRYSDDGGKSWVDADTPSDKN